MVTPEWLEAHGFYLLPPIGQWADCQYQIPSDIGDVDFKAGDLCYIEKDFHRNLFCIVLTPETYSDDSQFWEYKVYVMEDVGCGFHWTPFRWGELRIKTLQLLYEAFMGKNIQPALQGRGGSGSIAEGKCEGSGV